MMIIMKMRLFIFSKFFNFNKDVKIDLNNDGTVELHFYAFRRWNNHRYDPDVEYILRINHAGRKFTMGGGGGRGEGIIPSDSSSSSSRNKCIINRALWPLILDRAYNKSFNIYDTLHANEETKDSQKSAVGLLLFGTESLADVCG
jgi:hypothetical protein